MSMPPDVLAEKIKTVLSLLEEIADDMDDSGTTCACCGLLVRKNMTDFQAKQATEAAANRIARLYEKLFDGTWPGRELAPVVSASTIRDTKGKP